MTGRSLVEAACAAKGSVGEDGAGGGVAGWVVLGGFGHGWDGWLAAALAGAALGAAAAGSGADDFAGAAVRAGDVHIHIAKGDLDALGVGVAADVDVRVAFATVLVGDEVNDAGGLALEVGDGAVDGGLVDLREFFHGQVGLGLIR